MYCKAVLLAIFCSLVLVSTQTLEEQESNLSNTQDDVALLETDDGAAPREKRFLFKKKALGIGLGLGAGLGFVKGYKIGKLSNQFGSNNYGYGNSGYGNGGYGNGYGYGGSSYGHGGSYGSYDGHSGSYYPSYNGQHYHHYHSQPHATYGPPSYNDYYNNNYQGQGSLGSGVQTDGYNYNRPNSYDNSGFGGLFKGQKSLTVGGQWSAGIGANHNAGGQW